MGTFSGFGAAANDDGVASFDDERPLSRKERAFLITDIIKMAAEEGWNDVVAASLRTSGVPSLAHTSDDDLIELFVYLGHELRLEAM